MAELILTEKEKHANDYLEWDDAALGRVVKKLALNIQEIRGDNALLYTSCAALLASEAAKKAGELSIDIEGRTNGWTVAVFKTTQSG